MPENTHDISTAWRVDFNMALISFEPLVAGLRRLIDLATSANVPGGARLVFVSSISVIRGNLSSLSS